MCEVRRGVGGARKVSPSTKSALAYITGFDFPI